MNDRKPFFKKINSHLLMTEIFVESNLVMTRKSPTDEVKLVVINLIGYLTLGSICAELYIPIPSSTSAQLNS